MSLTLEQRVERLEGQLNTIYRLIPDLEKYVMRGKKAGQTRTQKTLTRILDALSDNPALAHDIDKLAAAAETSPATIYNYMGRGMLKLENKLAL